MEIVDVVAKQNFYDSRCGDVLNKQRFRLPRYLALQLSSINLVEILGKQKATPQLPVLLKPLQSGPVESHASSAAALPSTTKIVKPLSKGRRKKAGVS